MNRIAALIASAAPAFAVPPAFAHGGHGALTGHHWHATDTAGFVVVALLAAAALWMSRGK